MKALTLAAAFLAAMTTTAFADDLIGDWRTAADDNGNSGIIRVAQCGSALCGTLIAAFDGSGASMESDNVGRQIIWETNPTSNAGEYIGRLYSPDRDQEYNSRLQLNGNTLTVSGCVMGRAICREGGVWQRAN